MTDTIRRIEFASLTELAEYASKAPKGHASMSTEREHGEHQWTYGVLRPGAVQMAKSGWPDGAAKARALLDKLDVPPIVDTHSATVNDVTGSYVDVGEYVQGTPECMVDFKPDTRPVRFVHVIVSGIFPWQLKGDNIMQRGVTIAAIVDALESRGIRCSVELLTRFGARYEPGHYVDVSVCIKDTTQPLNLDVLTFAVAHPATFRRLLFAVGERQPEDIREKFGFKQGRSYGRVVPIPAPPDALVFQTMTDLKWTAQETRAQIMKALETYAS